MNFTILAHAQDMATDFAINTGDKWGWDEPLGLSVFLVGLTLTLYLLALTIKTLASIDPEMKTKKRK